MYDIDGDDDAYAILLLSDSNLPTGSFVASSGLESSIAHGFFSSVSASEGTLNFIRDSLNTYARSALPFVSDVHIAVDHFLADEHSNFDLSIDRAWADVRAVDELYEAMTLNHVAKRASKSQGVALLTLYSKGFSRPAFLSSLQSDPQKRREFRLNKLVDHLKLAIRREDMHGHLPICWGVLTSALGLTLERSQVLHLFLHARSLLSAAVRLNTVGPYGSQQLLLHAVRPLVQAEMLRCKDLRTGELTRRSYRIDEKHGDLDDSISGPASTWPLGEILAVRHDLQHSRIFNS